MKLNQKHLLLSFILYPIIISVPVSSQEINYVQNFNYNPTYSNFSYNLISSSEVVVTSMPTEKNNFSIDKEIKSNMKLRRNMLEWHQISGFTTWGLWLATNLAGEQASRNYQRKYEPIAQALFLQNPNENALLAYGLLQYSEWESTGNSHHSELARATFFMYTVTAALAFTSPSKADYVQEEGWSTIWTHKAMIWIHLPSMLALAYLGPQVQQGGPHTINQMQTAGWAGFSALTIAIATFYF